MGCSNLRIKACPVFLNINVKTYRPSAGVPMKNDLGLNKFGLVWSASADFRLYRNLTVDFRYLFLFTFLPRIWWFFPSSIRGSLLFDECVVIFVIFDGSVRNEKSAQYASHLSCRTLQFAGGLCGEIAYFFCQRIPHVGSDGRINPFASGVI